MNELVNKILEQATPYNKADFCHVIFGSRYSNKFKIDQTLVLFGAGSAGKELLSVIRFHGLDPDCFCDNNAALAGSHFCGLPVISFNELTEAYKNSLIVITTNRYCREILIQLLEAGFDSGQIFTIAHGPLSFYTHIDQWRWSLADLEKNGEDLLRTYNILSDVKSKDLFIKRIALFAQGADYRSFRSFICEHSDLIAEFGFTPPCPDEDYENYMYFNNDLVQLKKNEVYVDVGAYNGDSAEEFIKACISNQNEYKKIYCLEPDTTNYEQLLSNMARHRDVKCFPLGLWSHATKLKFESSKKITEARSARVVEKAGDLEISATSLDSLLPNEKITLIKMDIEGAECEALRGAAETIRKNKPTLVISAYHSRDDIFKIPLIVNEICSDYLLYLRLFSSGFTETVLIAVPKLNAD